MVSNGSCRVLGLHPTFDWGRRLRTRRGQSESGDEWEGFTMMTYVTY